MAVAGGVGGCGGDGGAVEGGQLMGAGDGVVS